MFYLVSVLLSEPDLILELDPIDEILALWKQYGVRNVMLLDRVSIKSMAHFYTDSLTRQLERDSDSSDLSILFDAPEPAEHESENKDTHQMLLAVVESTVNEVRSMLDETDKLIQNGSCRKRDLMFVLPLAYVKGFPGFEADTLTN